jgi:WD40 repeat protein
VAIAWTIGERDWRGVNHPYDVKEAICSDDGAYLLAFFDQPTLILYDVKDDFSWRPLEHPNFVGRAWITRDGAVLTTCWDGAVREFDLKTLELRCLQQHSGYSELSPDQVWIATAVKEEPCVRLWKRREAQARAELPHPKQVHRLAFSPDAALLATTCADDTVHLWDLAAKQALWTDRHAGVYCISFDYSGNLVATGGNDANVMLRDARTGAVVHIWPQEGEVNSLAFSPGGSYLAVSLSYKGPFEVKIWDMKRGELTGRLAHEETVHGMDWNRDGTLLATASQDHRVRVFEAASRRELVRLQFRDICASARFVPDTQELLSTSYDGSLWLSIINPEVLVERALTRVPRHLTGAEWQQYLPDEPLPEPAAGSATQ